MRKAYNSHIPFRQLRFLKHSKILLPASNTSKAHDFSSISLEAVWAMPSTAVHGEQYVHAKQATDKLTITHRLDAVLLVYARGQ